MKIDKLHIDGFGVFHDKQIEGFKPGINILYGKNEAGKSTLLDFIRFTLFDYPTYKVDRREPLKGGNHGGTIWMHADDKEPLSVFRTGDKKTFTLNYKGDTTTEEQIYQRLIGNASADLYNNIFAISIDELSEIDALDESGMKHKIFSMGLGIGDVDLGAFENSLNEHALSLFKPRGSTQKMIELVNDLEQKENKIHELQSNLTAYNTLSDQAAASEQQLDVLKVERGEVYRQLQKLNNYGKAYEHFVKYKQAETLLEEYKNTTDFPIHYLDAYKELNTTLKQHEENSNKLEDQLEKQQKQCDSIHIDNAIAPHVELLDYFKRNIAGYEEALTKKEEVTGLLQANREQQQNLLHQLGNSGDKKELLSITNTHNLLGKADEFQQQIEQTTRAAEQKTQQKTALENDIHTLKHKLNALKEDQNKWLDGSSIDSLTKEKNNLEVLLNKALQGKSATPEASTTNKYIAIALSILLIAAGGILFSQGSSVFAIVFGVIGLIFLLISIYLQQNKGKANVTISTQDPLALNKSFNTLKDRLERIQRINEEIENLRISLESQEQLLLKASEEASELEKKLSETHSEWEALLKEQGLPNHLSPKNVRNYIKDLNTIQELDQQEGRYYREIIRYKNIAKEMISFYQKCYPETENPSVDAINSLIAKLDEAHQLLAKKEQLEANIKATEESLGAEKRQVKVTKDAIAELFNKMEVSNESAFLDHFKKLETKNSLLQEIQQEETVLKTICGIDQFDEAIKELEAITLDELKLEIKEKNELFEQLEQEYSEKEKDLARTRTEIKHILEPNEMYALLNEKESIEAQLKEVYKEWLATKIALTVLNETKLAYEKDKQPEVITYSREYFKAFTNNAYNDVRISLSKQEVGLIDHTGRLKQVQELSRGTKEQLMLALRLGLITEYEKNAESLPVVFDDIMVNFDKERAANICAILKDFSKERQIIFFTCHEYTADLLKEAGGHIVNW